MQQKGRYCVYVYRDPRPGKNNEPMYVGKGSTSTGRARQHLTRGINLQLLRKLSKIKSDGLEPIIDIVSHHDDEDEAYAAECELIAKYGRVDKETGTLCNLTDGGKGNVGATRSDSEKARLQKQWIDKARDAVRAGNISSWADPVRKSARLASMKAAFAEPEFRRLRGEAISKAKSKYWIFAEGKRYDSAIKAANDLGMTASNVYFKCKNGSYQRELRN